MRAFLGGLPMVIEWVPLMAGSSNKQLRRGRREDEEGGEGFGDPQVGGCSAAVVAGGEEKPVHVKISLSRCARRRGREGEERTANSGGKSAARGRLQAVADEGFD
ncbi:hypothetical protein IHE45_02G032200 [Dioscorea alata]|uniref:Uncharacterized protein n=1 Tax=Dioscorea alata TaxID=55571 RepID=A0ACB7WPR8_DIOAL|nr:hypothetical protein IHE45_02G032200 [Dioscorea alata]